jgi:hypothetical protein
MSIILTIYVTFAHFIKTNVNDPNYICNINPFYKMTLVFIKWANVTYIVRIIDIRANVAYIVRMIDIRANATYIVRMIVIKTNVNHPNYICNISPFYKN